MFHLPRLGACLLILTLLGGCERTDEQAVRHAVTAELIERYRVREDHVRLLRIENAGGGWIARAEIISGGRAGERRVAICRVERMTSSPSGEARWTLTTVEDREIEAIGADPGR